MEKLKEVSEWLMTGEGIVFILFTLIAIAAGVVKIMENKSKEKSFSKDNNENNDNKTVSINKPKIEKKDVKILFVDDDTKFKVINIIKNSGWKNTKIVKDISNLDMEDIRLTDIFFIDIQGVGKKLNFIDEGLGLANALKLKYPEKKVVIYSAETRGDRFHDALRKADDFLAKNAEPFEFQQTIERLTK